MRKTVAVLLLILVSACAFAMPAYAQSTATMSSYAVPAIGNSTAPVPQTPIQQAVAPATTPQPAPPMDPNAAQPAPPQPVAAANGGMAPNATPPNGNLIPPLKWAENLMDNSLTSLAGIVAPAMDISTNLGLTLCKATTVMSICLGSVAWWFDGMALITIVRNMLARIVEFSLWIWVIANTWGGFGWFQHLLTAAASIGSTLGGVSFSIAPGSFSSNVLPGELLTLGAQLFTEIVGAAEFGKGGIASLFMEAATGDIFFETVIFVIAFLSGCWAFFVMAYASYRLWLSLAKVYIIAPLSFLQGLAGSRRLSPMSGSFISGAIILGLEVCTTFILTGLLYNIIAKMSAKFSFAAGSVVTNPPWYCTLPIAAPFCAAYGGSAIKLGELVAINLVLTLFAWAIRDVPRIVRDALEGRFSMSPQEVTAVMASSPSMAARAIGHGMNTVNAGASGGAPAAFRQAVQPAVDAGKAVVGGAAMVALGAATGGVGAAAVATAAARGGMLGGARGAVLSAAGKAVAGEKMAAAKSAHAGGETGTITSAASSAASAASKSQKTTTGATDGDFAGAGGGGGAGQDSDAHRTVSVDTDYQADAGSAPPAPDVDGASQRSRTTTIDENIQRGGQGGTAASGGAGGGGSLGAGSPSGAAATAGSSSGSGGAAGGSGFGGGGGGGGGGGSAGGAGGAIGQMAQELDSHMSVGKMFAMKALYMNARTPPPPPPPPDERSASLPISVVGNRP
jgi:hypothetical protein